MEISRKRMQLSAVKVKVQIKEDLEAYSRKEKGRTKKAKANN